MFSILSSRFPQCFVTPRASTKTSRCGTPPRSPICISVRVHSALARLQCARQAPTPPPPASGVPRTVRQPRDASAANSNCCPCSVFSRHELQPKHHAVGHLQGHQHGIQCVSPPRHSAPARLQRARQTPRPTPLYNTRSAGQGSCVVLLLWLRLQYFSTPRASTGSSRRGTPPRSPTCDSVRFPSSPPCHDTATARAPRPAVV